MSSTNASFSANLLQFGGVLSIGNLTPGSSKGCRTLHSQPNSSGISLDVTFTSDELLSSESPSLVGSLVCPSVICCIQVLGLQVAVTAGWDGDPSGRLILGLLVHYWLHIKDDWSGCSIRCRHIRYLSNISFTNFS